MRLRDYEIDRELLVTLLPYHLVTLLPSHLFFAKNSETKIFPLNLYQYFFLKRSLLEKKTICPYYSIKK